MENLTLDEMNAAYSNVVSTYGDRLSTKQDGLKLFITIKSDCNPKDKTGIIFDQAKMAIYKTDICCEECRCQSAVSRLIPVIQDAINAIRR